MDFVCVCEWMKVKCLPKSLRMLWGLLCRVFVWWIMCVDGSDFDGDE